MKHKSNYALRLARRKSAGTVRITLPVSRQDLVTNTGTRFPMPVIVNEFTAHLVAKEPKTFERLRRADELELI